jgi:hypothetical protein
MLGHQTSLAGEIADAARNRLAVAASCTMSRLVRDLDAGTMTGMLRIGRETLRGCASGSARRIGARDEPDGQVADRGDGHVGP